MNQQILQRMLQEVHADVQKVGWYAIHVGAGDDFPNFAYTIGFSLLDDHPEVLIPNLAVKVAHGFLHMIYEGIKQGTRREAGVVYDDLAQGYQTQFVTITPRWRERLLTRTADYYRVYHQGKPFEALQMVMPDPQHRWPWEVDYSWRPQPLLNTDTETA